MRTTRALLIGGRSGAGKSSVGLEAVALLRAADVGHAYIEGDVLDAVHPAPDGDPDRSRITERNLAALWANYTGLGCHRLVYTNTACVLAGEEWMFTSALRGPRLIRVLLTASDATVEERLRAREQGSELEQQLRRSALMARHLEEHAAEGTLRVATDGRRVGDIAADVVAATGWHPRKSPETISNGGRAN
ncbi:hypothetical protein GCM10010277_21860 [Streptomyces longisporoflavus]|uniref:hypothetical protein n=1 Tax=Streptomyces longisporoflavus TaxID=28044 RepID=UPI00167E33BF|nr:hypothetical protein [Streptomyces longisporoflavus]GGV35796.1 hypothetical protein GCM10010277_21860 [Streptomyces longisporoflavus]